MTGTVGGAAPTAVNDASFVDRNSGSSTIDVLANDKAGTSALDTASVTITEAPASGTATVDPSTGAVGYTPAPGFHGEVTITYQVCDTTVPVAACDTATLTVTVKPAGPSANDDAASTSYESPVTVSVLANDVAGAQPLQPESVSIASGPSSGSATVNIDGSISYTPKTGFVGSDSFTYSVCDSSSPTPLCDSATVTVVVNGYGVSLRYRLVTINYDVLGNMINATVPTQTAASARVANVALGVGSSGISTVMAGPTTGAACDADSPPGACDQFHVISFLDNPCAVTGAELVLSVDFECASGAPAASCGFVNANAGGAYQLTQLMLTYDMCARVVEYGVDDQASFLRLHEDAARQTPVSAPVVQGEVLYGRCAISPTTGAQFQSVTLTSLAVIRQSASGPVNMGDQKGASWMTMQSALEQTSPSNPLWDFAMELDGAFFDPTESYYLEATLDLTFANTGPLTRRLVLPIDAKRRSLVAMHGRSDEPQREAGVASEVFRTMLQRDDTAAADATSGAADGASAVVGPSASMLGCSRLKPQGIGVWPPQRAHPTWTTSFAS